MNMDFVPMWDGLNYFDELAMAIIKPFNLLNFNLFRHPSMFYMFVVAIPQYIDFGNTYLLHAINLIFGLLAIWSFHQLIKQLFPSDELNVERSLLAMIFGGYPILIACALNLNPDFGVLVYFLLLLSMMGLNKKKLALLFGFLLVFSKETGFLIYIATISILFVCFIGRSKKSTREKIISSYQWIILILPPLSYGAYLLYRSLTTLKPVLWETSGNDLGGLLKAFTSFSLFDPVFLGYIRGIFVINFNWFLSIFIFLFAITWLLKIIWGKNFDSIKNANGPYCLCFWSLFIVILFLLTRYSTFTNLRYFLPVYPFLIISFYYSLIYFIKNAKIRITILLFFLIFSYSSNFRTIDPVSKIIFGTFNFGKHSLLKMTEITGECCGYGRDQLVYNLEHIQFNSIQNKIYQDLLPIDKTILVANKDVDWHFIGRIDRETLRRTLTFRNIILINYKDPQEIAQAIKKPEVIYYLDYPNFDNKNDLKLLSMNYIDREIKNIDDDGYFITIHKMTLKNSIRPD